MSAVMALRAMPQVGGKVLVNFLDATTSGTVKAVRNEGRELDVETAEGEGLTFALNRATARFTLAGQLTGARLTFTEHAESAQMPD
jgi:hypothetical protein